MISLYQRLSSKGIKMHKYLLELPARIDTKRLYLRGYQAGDGPWYHAMSQKNKPHLTRFEAGNAVNGINTEEQAEIVVRDFAVAWAARSAFFMGVFHQVTHDFVAQIYIGVVNWDLPEFELGYFADVDYEGQGYVSEAAEAALGFIFDQLKASRVRLECDDTNTRSFRVAERCGMVKEGHIRENKRNTDGSFAGTLIYGLLRSEYLARESKNE
jgi:[ribosomal protein S5]-alanine N-acetyltransferase